ncbi:MAG: folate-binding protein [Candidatus Tokpelaia sp.]|nr:MAG: folate-binding protein [Candidatus Tokpelaia sp.]KAA6206927.1 MAG: folate-binding protein [Candidatus Tokpelaia sp.]
MTQSPSPGNLCALLTGHRLVHIGGIDAAQFLNTIITADIAALAPGIMAPAALLSPQGKIMFDFLIAPMPAGAKPGGEAGFLLDIAAPLAEDFVRRLSLYKLRANVQIAPPQNCLIGIITQAPITAQTALPAATLPAPCFALHDARFPPAASVCRVYYQTDNAAFAAIDKAATAQNWDRLRIAHAVPESGSDFIPGDIFPHNVNYDCLGAVARQKGCYIGQEIVARMQHKTIIRKRLVQVEAQQALPPSGTEILLNGKIIGRLGTVCDQKGLALIRLDKIPPAGSPAAQANEVALHFIAPPYLPQAISRPE